MKRTFFLICVLIAQFGHAQIATPVQWSFSAKKIDATTFEVHLTATIEEEWHMYSQTTPEGGPSPTAISFTKNPLLTLTKGTSEVGKLEKRFEVLFGVEVRQYSGKVDFVQMVKLKAPVKTSLTGSVVFMTCNDHECLPPMTQKFSVQLH